MSKTLEGADLSAAVAVSTDEGALTQRTNVATPVDAVAGNWLSRFFARLEARELDRQRREFEDYLSDATDLVDLEARIRRYDRRAAGAGFGL